MITLGAIIPHNLHLHIYFNSSSSVPSPLASYTQTAMATLRSRETGEWLHQDSIRSVQKFDDFVTIDWMDDEQDDYQRHVANLKKSATFWELAFRSTRTWLVLGAMGIIIGIIAASLNVITAWLASMRTGYCKSNFYLSERYCCWGLDDDHCENWTNWLSFSAFNYLMFVLLLATFLITAAFLVKLYAPTAAGSGISEIKCIVSGFAMRGFLGWSTLVIKSAGLPLAIASGLSLGKEGPSVHYAVCVGNSLAKLFYSYRHSASKAREFLTATAAAGVAVAFGSPMGGVLFAMEEISAVFQLLTLWKSYVCALIAVATLYAFNPFRTGQLVLFEVTYDSSWHYYELPFYALLGVFGGVYGIIVSRLNKRVAGFRKKYLAAHPIREVVILAIFTASISFFNNFLRLDMTEAMQALFSECSGDDKEWLCEPNLPKGKTIISLMFATVMRMFFTIITYGCKVPAGIFVPSMAAGATFGRAVGLIVQKLHESFPELSVFSTCPKDGPCVIPGTYAFIGAGAALSGITHLTVTVAIIMFELTGAVKYIIPTMISIAITKAINDKWGQGGIADQMILFNGLPNIDPKDEFSFKATVEDAMSFVTTVFVANVRYSMKDIQAIVDQSTFRGFPVVASESRPEIVGYVMRSDLKDVFNRVDQHHECIFDMSDHADSDAFNLRPILNVSLIVVSIDTKLEYLMDIFVRMGPRHVLVQRDGVLAGTITRKDILRYERTKHEMKSPAIEDGWDYMIWSKFQVCGELVGRALTAVGIGKYI